MTIKKKINEYIKEFENKMKTFNYMYLLKLKTKTLKF